MVNISFEKFSELYERSKEISLDFDKLITKRSEVRNWVELIYMYGYLSAIDDIQEAGYLFKI